MRGANGVIYPAGLRLKQKGTSRRRQRHGVYRAVVVNTIATDVEGPTGLLKSVVCDIIYLRSLQPKLGVPVAQNLGVNDGETWNPKPTTGTVSGADLTLPRVFGKRGSREGEMTPADDYNGDIVLIQFIEGDPEFPMITGSMTHEESKRLPVAGPGWDADSPSDPVTAALQRGIPALQELYRRFAGTEQRINEAGDYLVDTVDANTDDAPINPLGGEIRFRVKGSRRFTVEMGGFDVLEIYQVGEHLGPLTDWRVDFVEGATEQFVRGTTFIGNLNAFLTAFQALLQALVGALDAGSKIAVDGVTTAPVSPVFSALGQLLAVFAGTTPFPFVSAATPPIVYPVPPAVLPGLDPLSVFIATLIDEVTLSTHIKGD